MTRTRLLTLYGDIERRTRATTETHAWWPCRRGCDTCCHRLAEIPRMVRAEWEMLRDGLDRLAPEARAGVDARIAELALRERAGTLSRHVVCPMLDREAGACLVYEHRPGACRTYGFYVERGLGLHCDLITEAVAERLRDEEPIVWGNAEGIDAELARLEPVEPAEPGRHDGDYTLGRRPATEAAPLPLTAWVSCSSSSSGALPEEPPEPPPESPSPSSSM